MADKQIAIGTTGRMMNVAAMQMRCCWQLVAFSNKLQKRGT